MIKYIFKSKEIFLNNRIKGWLVYMLSLFGVFNVVLLSCCMAREFPFPYASCFGSTSINSWTARGVVGFLKDYLDKITTIKTEQ